VGTRAFADAVIERLGLEPRHLLPITPAKAAAIPVRSAARIRPPVKKVLVGVDVFIDEAGAQPADLAQRLKVLRSGQLELEMISNRGMRVWPGGLPETTCVDVFRCRFRIPDGTVGRASHDEVTRLLHSVDASGLEWVKTELLFTFDGEPGFTRSQGG